MRERPKGIEKERETMLPLGAQSKFACGNKKQQQQQPTLSTAMRSGGTVTATVVAFLLLLILILQLVFGPRSGLNLISKLLGQVLIYIPRLDYSEIVVQISLCCCFCCCCQCQLTYLAGLQEGTLQVVAMLTSIACLSLSLPLPESILKCWLIGNFVQLTDDNILERIFCQS